MNTIKQVFRQWSFLLLILALVPMSAFSANRELVVICNMAVSQDQLNDKDIQQIYLGRKTRWSDNQKIDFVIMKEGIAHSEFLNRFISKTPSQYSVFWKKMIFTGQGKPPLSFNTPEEVIEYVSRTPGAIGYVPADVPHEDVKVLSSSLLQ